MSSICDPRQRYTSTCSVTKDAYGGSSSKITGTSQLLAEDNPDIFDSESSWSNEPARAPESEGLSKFKLLSKYYRVVKHQFLPYQSQTLGLFCSNTASYGKQSIAKGRVAHVRENIYCATAVWALGQAYKLVDNDGGRTHELEHSAIKCLRGILFCWMSQYRIIEKFKFQQLQSNSLHTVFDALTGEPLDPECSYPHLQVDIQALFLLTIVQLTSSGLQIIWTNDEVNFVQNLVYYIERSYRVSDFGFWERGTKYNNGEPELHASSLAMAKAALEAINGFNVMGDKGTSSSIIYVDLDAHNRNLQTLEALLPRESSSKNTDMALLTSIGYPAFAINSHKLRDATQNKILKKLNGTFGLKRYLRDGYGCDNEDDSRTFYNPSEIQNFEGVECQWPLGFVMLQINALFSGDLTEAKKYFDLIEPLLVMDDDGLDVLPKFYYVDEQDYDHERKHPNQASREHSGEGTDGKLFLLGQSLFFISRLLYEGMLQPSQLDPIGRHQARGKKSKCSKAAGVVTLVRPSSRYSEFQAKAPKELCVQVCVIAQTTRLQSLLATYGILSQTPNQIEPVQICSPTELVRAYSYLGTNKQLGLSGRPNRPFGALSTSKMYKIRGRTVVAYPLVFEQSDFYMALDMTMLVEDIRDLLRFVWNSWSVAGRPLITCILREDIFNSDQAAVSELLQLLTTFRRGHCVGVPVKLGRMQTFISACCWESLDFLSAVDANEEYKFQPSQFTSAAVKKELFTDDNLTVTATATDTAPNKAAPLRRSSIRELPKNMDSLNTAQLLNLLYASSESLQLQTQVLTRLMNREGPNFSTSRGTVGEWVEQMIHIAAVQHHWSVVRHCSGLLKKTVDSLAPAVTNILVSGRFVTIGVFGHKEELIVSTILPAQMHQIIFDCCLDIDPREAVLQQEVLISCSKLVLNCSELFKGMLKIRIGWIIQLMKEEFFKQQAEHRKDDANISLNEIRTPDTSGVENEFFGLSPRQIKELLREVLAIDVSQRSWKEQRSIDGSLNRSPFKFYDKFWSVLEKCPLGVQLGRFLIPQQPTLSEMTNYDLKFSMLVEEMLQVVKSPNYRQILIEMMMITHTVFERNPELKCTECVLNLDQLMEEAVSSYACDHVGKEGYPKEAYPIEPNSHVLKDRWFDHFYNVAPHVKNGTVKYMLGSVMSLLLSAEFDISKSSIATASTCHLQ
ncbi:phosphorylase b kinase regulatory subunit beta-like [Convolutriloba macropyga]|uniref:phosphorylase b kinase regulatory subunit beta-like n=1 Tax=Convolutriloba macropyga TaxID=536237 RepID=UPI003F522D44